MDYIYTEYISELFAQYNTYSTYSTYSTCFGNAQQRQHVCFDHQVVYGAGALLHKQPVRQKQMEGIKVLYQGGRIDHYTTCDTGWKLHTKKAN